MEGEFKNFGVVKNQVSEIRGFAEEIIQGLDRNDLIPPKAKLSMKDMLDELSKLKGELEKLISESKKVY